MSTLKKTLKNTTASQAKKNVSDIKFWGDGDTFKLISKAHSEKEGWMKSTKAMEIHGVGCVVQVTTQQGQNVAEALTYVPYVMIQTVYNSKDRLKNGGVRKGALPIGRRLIEIVEGASIYVFAKTNDKK